MDGRKIYDYFAEKGFSPCGIFGLMGNLLDESGLNPRNLQDSYEKKLGYTDDSYTEAVDSGTYKNFVKDAAGYGLAQWTYSARKDNLLKYAMAKGVSIGDEDMQLDFMYQELQGYKTVFTILKIATTIKEASDIVMTQYEKPADQSDSAKNRRAMYGRQICDQLTGLVTPEPEGGLDEAQVRQKVISIAVGWYGCKEADGSHRMIIDTYNNHTPLARGYKVKYSDFWCATFGSAVAIVAGYTDIIPTECGCGQMIALFQAMKRWVENDAYIPSPGDYIFYDWDDNGVGDNTGWPEHVGIVISVYENKIKVIEGNKDDAVGYREITVNGRYIRGYGIPDYGSKATASGSISRDEQASGSASGNSICMTPQWVGIVTAAMLNVRKWAGKEYDNIKSWPKLAGGNTVEVCDSVKTKDGSTWYYIRIHGRFYGFVHSGSIKPVPGTEMSEIKVGQVVHFTGKTHYTSSYNSAAGKSCKPGKAKVTAINPGAAHPYHIVAEPGSGSNVYGWVDTADIG